MENDLCKSHLAIDTLASILGKYPTAASIYISYLKSFSKWDVLLQLYRGLKRPFDEGMLMLKQAFRVAQVGVRTSRN